jgi:hypothetical protein
MLLGSEDSSARLTDGERGTNDAPIIAQYRMSLAVLEYDGIMVTPLLIP